MVKGKVDTVKHISLLDCDESPSEITMKSLGDSQMTVFKDLAMKTPCPLLCDKSPSNFIVMSLGDSSQSNCQGHFTVMYPRVSSHTILEINQVTSLWTPPADSSEIDSHGDFTVE